MNYNVYRGDDMNEDYLTIGELAQKMDVTVRTLQYYDREGLLKPAAIIEIIYKKELNKNHA